MKQPGNAHDEALAAALGLAAERAQKNAHGEALRGLPAHSQEFTARMDALLGEAPAGEKAAPRPRVRVWTRRRAAALAAAACVAVCSMAVYAAAVRFGRRTTREVTDEYISFSWEENEDVAPSETLYAVAALPEGYEEDLARRQQTSGILSQTFTDPDAPDAPMIVFTQHAQVGLLSVNNETDEKQDVLVNGAEGFYVCNYADEAAGREGMSALFWNNGDKLFDLCVFGEAMSAETLTAMAESVCAVPAE